VRVLVLASALILSACGTTPLAPDPRPKPIEAMEPCSPQLCKLRPEVVNLELADQLAMILACHVSNAESYRRCEIKHRALTEWIGE
jgi:hypothetical protein